MIRVAKTSLLALKLLLLAFSLNACGSVEYITLKCKANMPLKPHLSDFKDEFDYLQNGIFVYTYELESELQKCL